ncbi:MAG TPA: hypothetical protein VFO10_22455 [Oligoflexus sp.]|nr:hypothetical protein [Oligoflexus sp.]HET9240041.1 hypothetical protein [Oligoflexus sp.]
MSHLEFAIRILPQDGTVWRAGAIGEAPAFQDLTLSRKAHENDYSPAE